MSRGDEQAFPAQHQQCYGGMTLREYFAGLAMQGLEASPDTTSAAPTDIAKDAVQIADALLAELAKAKP